jgi:secreted trypsin-like serine protease
VNNSVAINDQNNYLHYVVQGDSGGPMSVKNSTAQHNLAGITSWGAGCATVSHAFKKSTGQHNLAGVTSWGVGCDGMPCFQKKHRSVQSCWSY